MSKVYTVRAFKYGDRSRHSYIACVTDKKQKALEIADREERLSGLKYVCEVVEYDTKDINYYKVILVLDIKKSILNGDEK